MFVAGPPVVNRLSPKQYDKQELGGWEIQLRAGAIDEAVDSEDEAFAATRRFLSYLPSSVYEAPPRGPVTDDPARREEALFEVIPRDIRKVYRIRPIIEKIVDQGCFFEMGRLYGRSVVTGFARIDGWPVAVMASDPMFYGGGWTADACQKVARFVDMAETFHLPAVYFCDCPGFLIGLEAEKSGVIRQGVRAMSAMFQTTIPWCTFIIRNAFGVAGAAHQNGARLNWRYAWPSGRWGSLPLEGGIEAAYRADIAAARRSQGQDGRDRGPPEQAALALPQRRDLLDRGDHRSARHAQDPLRVRRAGGPGARQRAEPALDAALAGARTSRSAHCRERATPVALWRVITPERHWSGALPAKTKSMSGPGGPRSNHLPQP